MRKVIVTEFLTLDDVMEAPDKWQFPYWHDEINKFKHDELFASDAQLLGRVTYQGFADAWPSMTGEYADRLNSLPKYVVSTTLKKVEWNNSRLINGNVVEEVGKLKQQPGQDILVHGSRTLVPTLMKAGLIDEYQLIVHPLVLGKGKRLFNDGMETTKLKLIEAKAFSSGVVLLRYQPHNE
jgi:dihydrofolate reductase